MLVERKDDPQSLQRGVALLEQATSAETPYAWTALADLHLDGAFPGADPAKGVAYLEHANTAGIPSDTARMGQHSVEGRGVPHDHGTAIPLLQQAAEDGPKGAKLARGQGYR